MHTRLYYIDIGYATFGIEVKDDTVIDAPPIAKWMIGKLLEDIEKFLIKRNAEVKQINYDNNTSIRKNQKVSTYCNNC